MSTKIRKWFPAVDVQAIPAKEGKKVSCGSYEIALFNLGGEYLAIDNKCPHKQGPLSDGIVSGKAVFCPLHNLKVSLENGCALNGGEGQVKTYPVKVISGQVCIAFEEGKLHSMENQPRVTDAPQNMMDVN